VAEFRTIRIVTLSLVALLALVAVPASARPTAPKIEILFVTPERLSDFAMDGNRVAWTGDRCRVVEGARSRISSRSLSGGPTHTIAPQSDEIYGDPCVSGQVALAGRRLFWVAPFGGHTTHQRVDTALVGAASSEILADHVVECRTETSFVDEIAGDAGTFAYTWVAEERTADEFCYVIRETAHVSVFESGGVSGGLGTFSVGSRPTALAVAPGRIATVEAPERFVPRVWESEIVVYTPDGRVVRRVKQSGSLGGLGMSGRWIAAVNVSGRSRQLRIFDARTGRRAVSVAIPTRNSRFQVAVSGTHAVVANGRTVWMLDIARRSLTLLAERPYIIRGLSIEGQRVAWGERVGARGRVVSALLG
jgi:hypothetical protein